MYNMILLLIKGFSLGSLIFLFGSILDVYIELNSLINLFNNHQDLYEKMQKSLLINLLCITPIYYSIINKYLVSQTADFSLFSSFIIVFIHNLLYYKIHKFVHQNKNLYWIHEFHHQFDKFIVPSVANAVSISEFIIMYSTPLLPGIILTSASESTLIFSVGIISIKNFAIHTPKLCIIPKIPYFNVPSDHIQHHRERSQHYSATYLDFDLVEEKVNVLINYKKEE